MPKLIKPLENLTKSGFRLTFDKNVSTILVGESSPVGYISVAAAKEGRLGVAYVAKRDKGSSLQYINASGSNITQIACRYGLFTIFHKKRGAVIFLEDEPGKSFTRVSRDAYEKRLRDELGFEF